MHTVCALCTCMENNKAVKGALHFIHSPKGCEHFTGILKCCYLSFPGWCAILKIMLNDILV